jgi:hypothetical protein
MISDSASVIAASPLVLVPKRYCYGSPSLFRDMRMTGEIS